MSITSSGERLAPDVHDYQIGLFLIVICVVNMITREFCYARDDGYVDVIDAPYHSDLRGYVRWAARVVRACCQRLGVPAALVLVGQAVDWAAAETTQAFGRMCVTWTSGYRALSANTLSYHSSGLYDQ